ncbi:MAG: STE like transcription factor-domain-containing protein [Benjaminiella poitrasii]|nr:MAG: STE like transcription factor-domain-containing protein [Benjaminiella poitrasii]
MLPNKENIDSRLEMIDMLKSFLINAPEDQEDKDIQHYDLPTGESIGCVKWNDAFFITGTDIVRCLVFRFRAFGRPVENMKKFEEGIFSDLRNLKPGSDAILEEPKSAFLNFLFKHNCIRTQKKQKVFYWHAVPHDRLFLDALERDLKREKMGIESTSRAVAYPADNISLDTTQAMFDEFRKAMVCQLNIDNNNNVLCHQEDSVDKKDENDAATREEDRMTQNAFSSTLFGHFSLFKGSPSYKQRRHRATQPPQQQQINKKKSSSTSKQQKSTNKKSSAATAAAADSESEQASDSSYQQRYFECPISSCRKVFKRLEHMKRHLRTHTLERPYLCDMCGKRFSRSDNLAQHKKTHNKIIVNRRRRHQQQQQQQQESRQNFRQRNALKRRRRNRHNKPQLPLSSVSPIMDHRNRVTASPTQEHTTIKDECYHPDVVVMEEDDIDLCYPLMGRQELFPLPDSFSSSANSSCYSSPAAYQPPMIKLEETTDLFNDQQPDMMLVDELLMPSEWSQHAIADYDPPRPTGLYHHLNQPEQPPSLISSSYCYAPSASSCLTSPVIPPVHFLMTPTGSNSVVTTAVNSPILMASDDEYYNSNPYYSHESPTMTPTDALLYHH